MLLIVSGASGVGKSTLCRRLLEREPTFSLSISVTTRPPRGQEKDGVHYHFVDRERFYQMVTEGAFAEWAEVHGNGYGTTREAIDAAEAEGRSLLFDIDWQGAASLREHYPDAISVMVFPPDLASLEARLRGRGEDAEDVVQRRLAAARFEMSKASAFDYVLVNDDVEAAERALRAIVEAARHRASRVLASLPEELALSDPGG